MVHARKDGGEGGIERRRYRRLDFSAAALIELDNETVCGEVRNISTKGVFLKTDRNFAANDQVQVTIDLLKGSARLSVTMPGTVVRLDPEGIGLTSPHINIYSMLHLELLLAMNRGNPQRLTDEFYKYVLIQ